MTDFKADPDFAVKDEQSLRALFPPTHGLAALKCLSALDKHAQDFIRRSPFLCIGTQNRDGKADVSPRGDPAGFVRMLDDRTLAIPDRPGNNRLDTLSNVLANPNVGLLFMIPGFDDTLRVNGRPAFRPTRRSWQAWPSTTTCRNLPSSSTVTEVFLHCAKAFRRSHLWDPEHFQNRKEMPSLLKIILDQTTGAPSDAAEMQKIDEGLEDSYRKSMY